MIYSILYVLFSTFALLLINKSFDSLPPMLSLLCASFLAALYFHIVNRGHIVTMYKKCWQDRQNWFRLSFDLIFVWVGTFYGTLHVGIFGFLYVFSLVMGVFAFLFKQIGERQFSWVKTLSILGLIGTLVIFIMLQEMNNSDPNYRLGILFSIVAGAMGYAYIKRSYLLFERTQLTSSQILATRFYGIMLFCLFFLPSHLTSYLTLQNLWLLLGITALNFVIPLYLSQKSILKIGPENASIIASTMPVVAYFVESIFLHHRLPFMFLISVACCLFLALPYVVDIMRKKSKQPVKI